MLASMSKVSQIMDLSYRPFNIVYCVISPFDVKRAPLNRGLPSGIHYYGIKYTKMSLEPKRKYQAKQILTNKYSEFKSFRIGVLLQNRVLNLPH
jgi:hypothetical protein